MTDSREKKNARMRRCRDRQRSDIKLVQIELNCLDREFLVDAGFIDFQDSDDKTALSDAVRRALASVTRHR